MTKRNALCADCGGPQPNGYAARCRQCHTSKPKAHRGVCWWGTCSRAEYVISCGLCSIHYSRAKRGIDMDAPVRGEGSAKRGVDPCSVDECTRKAFHGPSGLCAMHYTRFSTRGNVGPATPLPTGDSTRWHVDRYGYVRRRRWDPAAGMSFWETQHRVVMSEVLGRPLAKHENVHHINGIKTDNRPENLELWVTPQPSGQRPVDLAEWVVEQYPELVEAALQSRRQLRLVV